jgi:cellulose biosynthesis protein BcsQ
LAKFRIVAKLAFYKLRNTNFRYSEDKLAAFIGVHGVIITLASFKGGVAKTTSAIHTTTPAALAMDALLQTVSTLKSLGSDRYRVLLTIIPPAPRLTGQQAREALSAEGIPLFQHGIRRFAVYEKAALEGLPVYQVKDRSSKIAWREYQEVGKEILS